MGSVWVPSGLTSDPSGAHDPARLAVDGARGAGGCAVPSPASAEWVLPSLSFLQHFGLGLALRLRLRAVVLALTTVAVHFAFYHIQVP